jgi:hypothetical protein
MCFPIHRKITNFAQPRGFRVRLPPPPQQPQCFSQPNVAKIKWRWSGNAMQTVPPSEGGSRGRRGFGGVWWRAVLQIETTGDWLAPGLFAVEKPPVVADKCSVLAGWGGVVLRGTLEKID